MFPTHVHYKTRPALRTIIRAYLTVHLTFACLIFFSPAWRCEGAENKAKYPPQFFTDKSFCRKTLFDVDKIVSENLFDENLVKTVWKEAVESERGKIVKSANLKELSTNINAAVARLKLSHCTFVTTNDEMYHFLHSMFSDFNKRLSRGKTDFVGFHTGGDGFKDNQVRYVLDGSPAWKSGIQVGDVILRVNGKPYAGAVNFFSTAGSSVTVEISRDGQARKVLIAPTKVDVYTAYVNAMKESVVVSSEAGKKIGYIHVWCGGGRSHEKLDELLGSDKLANTDGLIFDLRDGYGGNDLADLDRFYRSEKAFPVFAISYRGDKKQVFKEFYDKPVVAIINGGSRSGKELLAFSLKRTGRAKLVGTKTAGAVLGGRLVPVNSRSSMYVAVFDGTIAGERLEGRGVVPDIEIENKEKNQQGYDKQRELAKEQLLKLLSTGNQETIK